MKYGLRDLEHDFPDEQACLTWLAEYRWPEGISCKRCKKITPHKYMQSRKSFYCQKCGQHTQPTAGTIFHKSSTPLKLWFYAIFIMTSTRSGVSAKQLERELCVTYKTAWRMFHQIRSMMSDDPDKNLFGEVEVDETYIGGTPGRRSSVKPHNKQIVFGMVQRGGKAKLRHVKSAGVRVLMPEIDKGVESEAVIYSDEHGSYRSLEKRGYKHETVIHSQAEYVRGHVHTQNIEGVWSTMKRGIKGVYRHVDPKYLQAYADEYAFRYSYRQSPSMFWVLLCRTASQTD
jgi:transposase-like protein